MYAVSSDYYFMTVQYAGEYHSVYSFDSLFDFTTILLILYNGTLREKFVTKD